MAEVDILIVNGTIVDGTDDPAFQGDVAVKNGTIVAVGDRSGSFLRVSLLEPGELLSILRLP